MELFCDSLPIIQLYDFCLMPLGCHDDASFISSHILATKNAVSQKEQSIISTNTRQESITGIVSSLKTISLLVEPVITKLQRQV